MNSTCGHGRPSGAPPSKETVRRTWRPISAFPPGQSTKPDPECCNDSAANWTGWWIRRFCVVSVQSSRCSRRGISHPVRQESSYGHHQVATLRPAREIGRVCHWHSVSRPAGHHLGTRGYMRVLPGHGSRPGGRARLVCRGATGASAAGSRSRPTSQRASWHSIGWWNIARSQADRRLLQLPCQRRSVHIGCWNRSPPGAWAWCIRLSIPN